MRSVLPLHSSSMLLRKCVFLSVDREAPVTEECIYEVRLHCRTERAECNASTCGGTEQETPPERFSQDNDIDTLTARKWSFRPRNSLAMTRYR